MVALNSLPIINYSVNTDHINASSPPLDLSSGDVLNYVHLNIKQPGGQLVMFGLRQEESPYGITLKIYDERDSNEVEARLDFSQLCMLQRIVESMVKNVGEVRGRIRKEG